MKNVAYCPRCFWRGPLEQHHVLPNKHFKGRNKGHKVHLCPNCHTLIHKRTDKLGKLSKRIYVEINKAFIRKKDDDIL